MGSPLGIRMALGAHRRQVMGLVLRQVSALVAPGVGIGVVTALALSRTLSGMLYGLSATAPVTDVAIALLLVATARLARFLPARGAARVDAMVALRAE